MTEETHTRSCPVPGNWAAECTCGLEWRIKLQALRELARNVLRHDGATGSDDYDARELGIARAELFAELAKVSGESRQ